MRKEDLFEERLNNTNEQIENEVDKLFKFFKKRDEIFDEAREALKNNAESNKKLVTKFKRVQKDIHITQRKLRYLNTVQAYLEDEIDFLKY